MARRFSPPPPYGKIPVEHGFSLRGASLSCCCLQTLKFKVIFSYLPVSHIVTQVVVIWSSSSLSSSSSSDQYHHYQRIIIIANYEEIKEVSINLPIFIIFSIISIVAISNNKHHHQCHHFIIIVITRVSSCLGLRYLDDPKHWRNDPLCRQGRLEGLPFENPHRSPSNQVHDLQMMIFDKFRR